MTAKEFDRPRRGNGQGRLQHRDEEEVTGLNRDSAIASGRRDLPRRPFFCGLRLNPTVVADGVLSMPSTRTP